MAYAELSKEERYARINKALIKPSSPKTDVQKRIDEAKKKKKQQDMEVRKQNGTPHYSNSSPSVSTPLLNQSKNQPTKQNSKASVSNVLADVLTPAERNKRDEWEILGNSNYTGEVDDIVQQDYKRYGVKNAEEYRKVSDTLGDSLLSGAVDSVRNTVNMVGYGQQLTPKGEYVSKELDKLTFGDENANNEANRLYAEYLREHPNGTKSREDIYTEAMNRKFDEENGPIELYDIANFGKKYSEETQKKVAELNENAQKDAQFYSTVGNMLPYIAISAATGGAGAATGIKAITTAGKVLSSSQMYLSAAGQATNEALKNGASAEDAVRYGNAVGAIELGTEAMFSGLGKAVGGVFGDVGMVDKLLGKAQKSMGPGAYKALSYVVDVAGEGLEELVSEWGDYAAAQIIDAGIDPRTVSEVNADAWESFSSGALLSFFMQTSSLMSQGVPMQEAVQQATEQSVEENLPQITTIADLNDASYTKRANRILADPQLYQEYLQTHKEPSGSKTHQAEVIARNLYNDEYRAAHPLPEQPQIPASEWYSRSNTQETQSDFDAARDFMQSEAEPEIKFTPEQAYVRGLVMNHSVTDANEIRRNPAYRKAFEQMTGKSLEGLSGTKATAVIMGTQESDMSIPGQNQPDWYSPVRGEASTALADALYPTVDSNANSEASVNPLADTLTNTQRGTTENGSQYSITPNPDGRTYNVSVTLPDGSTVTRNTFNPMEEIEDITWDSSSAEEYGMEFDEDVPIDEEFEAEQQTPSPQYAPQNRFDGQSNDVTLPNAPNANTEQSVGNSTSNVQTTTTQDSGVRKVSQTAETARDASVTPDSVRDLVNKEMGEGKNGFTYVPITNNASVANATQEIVANGWEESLKQWQKDVASGKSGDQMTTMGALLYNNAVSAGDTKLALDIMADYAMLGTNTARGLQAFRILKTLSPDSRLYMIQKTIGNIKSQNRLPSNFKFSDGAIDAFLNAKDEKARDAAIATMQQEVADAMPASFMDKWTALRYTNMLGNFRTQGRNLASNSIMLLTNYGKYGMQSLIEYGLNKVSGGKYQRNTSITGKKYFDAGLKDANTFMNAIQNGGKYNDTSYQSDFQSGIDGKRKIFNFKPLELYRKATNFAMEQGDIIFNKVVYARTVSGFLKAHGMDAQTYSAIVNGEANVTAEQAKLLDDARAFAIKEAQETTFHDNNAFSEWVSKIGRKDSTPKFTRLIAEGVLPFRKTPANILVRAEEYSPLGLVNTAVNAVKAKNGTATYSDVVNSLSKSLTGSGLIFLGFALRQLGAIRGAESDDDKKWFDNMNGQQEYSLVLPSGDTYTIDWAAPASILMFIGSQISDVSQMEDGFTWKSMEKIATDMAEPLVQMSMLQGVSDTLDGIKYSDNNLIQLACNATLSYLTQGLTNSLVGQVARTMDDNRMSTYVDPNSDIPDWIQKNIGKTLGKIPGVDAFQVDYVDAWGRKQDSGSLFENALSPGYISEDKITKVEQTLYDLYDETGINVFPDQTFASQQVALYDADGGNDGKRYLSKDEFVKYSTVKGQTSLKMVQTLMDSDYFDGMDSIAKAEAISDIYTYAGHAAASAVEKSTPEDKLDAINTPEGRVNFIMVNNLTSSRNDKNRDYEAIDNGIKLYNSSGKDVQNAFGSDFNKLSDAARHHIGSQEYYSVMDNTPESPKMAEELTAINRYASKSHKAWFVRNILSTQTRQKDGTTQRQRFDKALKEGCTTEDIIAALMAYQNKTTGQLTGKAKTAYLVIYK